jgi:hypothetical protein
MLHMCVYMHSHFIENHLIQSLEDGPLISEVVLSQQRLKEEATNIRLRREIVEECEHELSEYSRWLQEHEDEVASTLQHTR